MNGTIVAANTGGGCVAVSPTFITAAHSPSDDADCHPRFLTGDALLGDLDAYGGPTFSHMPLPGSPAVDVLPVEVCRSRVDQRGIARPQGLACDIGSVEVSTKQLQALQIDLIHALKPRAR